MIFSTIKQKAQLENKKEVLEIKIENQNNIIQKV